jgi:hypothetical protein
MVKENNAKEGFVLDTDDSSLTRWGGCTSCESS